jgi:hypothetical protein
MALQAELRSQGDFLFKYRSYFPLLLLVSGLAMFVLGKMSGDQDSLNSYQLWFIVSTVAYIMIKLQKRRF